MLSRVADAVYWMGRYLERAENITRVLLVTDDFATETQGFAEDLAQAAWKDVLAILPSAELTRPVSAFAPLSLPYLQAFFVDGRNPYSVHYSLRKARENARAVREALTVEVFTSINETFRAVEAHGERRPDVTGLRDARERARYQRDLVFAAEQIGPQVYVPSLAMVVHKGGRSA